MAMWLLLIGKMLKVCKTIFYFMRQLLVIDKLDVKKTFSSKNRTFLSLEMT